MARGAGQELVLAGNKDGVMDPLFKIFYLLGYTGS